MKKLFFIFVALIYATASWGAINVKTSGVKKAAPVATKQVDKLDSATSLLPTVINLVANVKALNVQQQQLTADCAPTTSEIEMVNNLVKEWAKTGTVTATAAESGLGGYCSEDRWKNSSGYYHNYMEYYADKKESCFENFSSDEDKGTVWYLFPKASKTEICDSINKQNCENISNIYDVFAKIPFTEEDFTEGEAKKISKFIEKMNRCAPGKLNAARSELVGNFLTQTLGSVGQSSGVAGTAAVLDAVSGMGGSGDIKSMLPSLGQMAVQVMDK